jgi:hypothetical protein
MALMTTNKTGVIKEGLSSEEDWQRAQEQLLQLLLRRMSPWKSSSHRKQGIK